MGELLEWKHYSKPLQESEIKVNSYAPEVHEYLHPLTPNLYAALIGGFKPTTVRVLTGLS